MNLKKRTCKLLSVLMTLVMAFSISVPAYASPAPSWVMDFSSGHSQPAGIVKGPDGKLYVSDHSGDSIVKMDADGQNKETVTTNVDGPVGLAFHSSGDLYVAEFYNKRVSKIDSAGNLTVVKDSLPGYLSGIAIDSKGDIFTIDFTHGKLLKMDKDGNNLSEFATGLQNSSLVSMTIDENDNLYLSVRSQSKVIKITPAAQVSNFIENVYSPAWVTLGEDGFFYVSTGNYLIKKANSTGTVVAEFSTSSFTPWGTYIDEGGYIYFCEFTSYVKKFVGSASTQNHAQIYLTMNSSLSGTTADPSAFTLTGIASNPSITEAKISEDTIILTLDASMVPTDTNIKLSYTKTGTNDLSTSASSFKLSDFSNLWVENNRSQNQSAPTGLTGVAPTFAQGTGKITGTTTAMEFKMEFADESTYTTCSAYETTITTPATYSVRFMATAQLYASDATSVVVLPYVPDNQNQLAPTGLVGVAPTSATGSGKIMGTTTAMEFKLASANENAYSACGAGETTVTTSSTYSVRFKAKSGYNAGTPASVTVPSYVAPSKKSSSDDSSSSGGGSTSTTKPTDKTVLINGNEEKAGTETKTTVNGVTSVTLTVDASALSKKIEAVLKNNTNNIQNLIEFSVSSGNNATVGLTGDIIKQLEKEDFKVSINKDKVTYVIPAAEITIENVANILKVDSDKLKDIEIEVRIKDVSADVLAKYNEIAKSQEHVFVVPPVQFEIVAKATGIDGVTRETTVSQFSNYVERIIELPANVDPSKITTGIVFNADGTYSHVPTVIFEKDGKYYAKLNSLTNSTYSVIYNPITVDTVEGHWAEKTVNDMASRLVLINYKNFAPDEAVTRAEFADYIVRALGLYREGEKVDSTFTDISTGSKYQISIEKSKEWGIISGYPDGTFKADKTVSREEAMVMYAKAMDIANILENKANKLNGYTDKEDVSSWATSSVTRVLNAEIFNGKGNGVLAPKDTLTKAEALTAVRNLLLQAELINN